MLSSQVISTKVEREKEREKRVVIIIFTLASELLSGILFDDQALVGFRGRRREERRREEEEEEEKEKKMSHLKYECVKMRMMRMFMVKLP